MTAATDSCRATIIAQHTQVSMRPCPSPLVASTLTALRTLMLVGVAGVTLIAGAQNARAELPVPDPQVPGGQAYADSGTPVTPDPGPGEYLLVGDDHPVYFYALGSPPSGPNSTDFLAEAKALGCGRVTVIYRYLPDDPASPTPPASRRQLISVLCIDKYGHATAEHGGLNQTPGICPPNGTYAVTDTPDDPWSAVAPYGYMRIGTSNGPIDLTEVSTSQYRTLLACPSGTWTAYVLDCLWWLTFYCPPPTTTTSGGGGTSAFVTSFGLQPGEDPDHCVQRYIDTCWAKWLKNNPSKTEPSKEEREQWRNEGLAACN